MLLDAEDFYQPRHQVLHVTLADMLRKEQPSDPTTMLAKLGPQRDPPRRPRRALRAHVFTEAWMPTSAGVYAVSVRERIRRRDIAEAAIRLVERIEQPDAEINPALDGHRSNLDMVPASLDHLTLKPP